ncbi:MAG: CsgG/HfaB family protein [Elusimicrobiota bacterium]
MRKSLYLWLSVLYFYLCPSLFSEKTNLAVADFAGKNVSAADASIVADFLRIELVNTNLYSVVEKGNMDKILAEAQFQLTGCTEAECAVQIGKILNVQRIVVGSLSKLVDVYYITASLIDVETAKILKAEQVEALSARELPEAAKELVKKLTGLKFQEKKEPPKPKEEKVPTPEKPVSYKNLKGPIITKEGVKFIYEGEAKEVFLAGSFNGWGQWYSMKEEQAGIWTITIPFLLSGKYHYKFIVDGNWVTDEKNPNKEDDGYGGFNSVFEISKKAYKKFGVSGPIITKKGVKFTYYAPSANKVCIAGEFNNWDSTADPMLKQSDGTWTITKKLKPGKYQYKFVVDDSSYWFPDLGNPNMVDDGFGGMNSVIDVK